ncbi:MAG: S-adenosylmethionine:tRNA ribosyltransferase-isomerase [Bacteroidales bacterium]|nr:S-adenosylmethionine:tRNA ribosyltransferase-isomerase [Bacteroidales bacterium]MDD4209200.1 S-adenosylmethionine:tRNA ribosyltransferase-isomerase [Bacteroidales bacterium]
MSLFPEIKIEDYSYSLPESKIAFFPVDKRDHSKLLIYDKAKIAEDSFLHLPKHLPSDSVLIFNNTRVIQARILIRKATGAEVEIFCLKPVLPSALHEQAFAAMGSCVWECFIGHNKRFKNTLTVSYDVVGEELVLTVNKLKATKEGSFLVEFSWTPSCYSFAEVLEHIGRIPLPPYIKRAVNEEDAKRYQTLYAKENGSVAAPTAGLHFSEDVIKQLHDKQIPMEYITLHVGAGTFKPVTESFIEKHVMHEESIYFHKSTIENILSLLDKRIICVGTTGVRSLESLYWLGVKLAQYKKQNKTVDEDCFTLYQWEVYNDLQNSDITPTCALQTILDYMEETHMYVFHASTFLMIVPGRYNLRMTKGIITNFHQPQSTLLLLIAVFVGDKWKEIYDYALTHDFRFLSYGDACLFL